MTARQMTPPSKYRTQWAKRRREKGQCVQCGAPVKTGILCETHRQADRLRRRINHRRKLSGAFQTLTASPTSPPHSDAYQDTEQPKLTEAAPIMSEICERLCELEEVKLGMAADVIHRLARVAEMNNQAFRYTIRLMHGDAAMFDSFEQQAEKRAITKQAVHCEFRSVLAVIERAFPELAHQIGHLRQQVVRFEEQARPGVNRAGQVVTVNRTSD